MELALTHKSFSLENNERLEFLGDAILNLYVSEKLYASYAKAHREPNRTDYENGNPKPENLDDFELGWRIKTTKMQAQANLYWMEYKDQLVLTGAIDEVGAPIRQNVGKSRRVGLELEFKMKLLPNWVWQPNLALSSNQNLDFIFENTR